MIRHCDQQDEWLPLHGLHVSRLRPFQECVGGPCGHNVRVGVALRMFQDVGHGLEHGFIAGTAASMRNLRIVGNPGEPGSLGV